jgi:hypothetical protein
VVGAGAVTGAAGVAGVVGAAGVTAGAAGAGCWLLQAASAGGKDHSKRQSKYCSDRQKAGGSYITDTVVSCCFSCTIMLISQPGSWAVCMPKRLLTAP